MSTKIFRVGGAGSWSTLSSHSSKFQQIPSRSGKDGTTSLPLGRGGGGPGNFVMAIVDHSFTRDALVWITDQIRRGLAPDQSVDGFLLILRLLWRQRRQEEEQRQGGQCSRHNPRQVPELPENQRQVWDHMQDAFSTILIGKKEKEKEMWDAHYNLPLFKRLRER